ncbi:MAG: DNA methyltransferase, partial [Candidatus Gracilibacteria bacterium]|nr:DNA methyltransferase [Candidatus Gracilibacteria bacterium]
NTNVTSSNVGIEHEYIYIYSKKINLELSKLKLTEENIDLYTYSDEFESIKGKYKLVGLNKTGTLNDKRPNLEYDIISPEGTVIKASPRWRWSKDKFEKGILENRVVFKKTKNGYSVYYKQYLYEDNNGNLIDRGNLIPSILNDIGRTTEGTLEVSDILGKGKFDFPKPSKLIKWLIDRFISKNALVLDFMAGSGTTGHAVLDLNKEDSGNRKFILCTNNENNICEEITYERIKRVSNGYTNSKGNEIVGLGGNLRYYETDFVEVDNLTDIDDEKKLELTYNAGELLAIKEGIYNELEKNSYGQIFENRTDIVAVYFKETATNIDEMEEKLIKIQKQKGGKVIWYIYGNPYKKETFKKIKNLELKDIPDPILKVYREINKV